MSLDIDDKSSFWLLGGVSNKQTAKSQTRGAWRVDRLPRVVWNKTFWGRINHPTAGMMRGKRVAELLRFAKGVARFKSLMVVE